ncbi:MAG: hypothetical protein PHU94_04405 [Bacilli bacterium]|nr:hypothetical protein [Bacilli bacterium]MDD4718474.1 hypothetical protein [Bacilli bacterium]
MILAIIMLIAFPLISKVVEEAGKGSLRNTAYGIVKSAEFKHADNVLNNKVGQVVGCGVSGYEVYKYQNGLPVGEELSFKGQRPKSGTIAIQSNGDVAVAVHNGKWCAIKNHDDSKIEIYDNMNETECEQMLPSGSGEGYIDVVIVSSDITALNCNGEVMVGQFYDLDNLIKVEGIPKVKKIYGNDFYLTEGGEVYKIERPESNPFFQSIQGEKILENVKDVFPSNHNDSIYFLMDNGKVMGLGKNYLDELGLGEESQSTYIEPVEIPGLEDVKTLATSNVSDSGITTFAILEDGSVKVWGRNLGGAPSEHEKDNHPFSATPQIIPGLTDVKDIVTTKYQSFAILENGSVKVWGQNDYCQLGMCGDEYIGTPTINPNLVDIKSISLAGEQYLNGLAIKNDGNAILWGDDFNDDNEPVTLNVSNVETGIITSDNVMLIDNNKKLHVLGRNDYYSVCPGIINEDGSFENLVTISDYVGEHGSVRGFSSIISKLELTPPDSGFEPLVQCLKGVNSVEDINNCWDELDPSHSIKDILHNYSVNGKSIFGGSQAGNNFYTCVVDNMSDFNAQKENCWSKLNLIEEHNHLAHIVECINDLNSMEDMGTCIDNDPDLINEFNLMTFDYDYNGNHMNPTSGGETCKTIYPSLQGIPYLKNIQKVAVDNVTYNDGGLSAVIINYNLFAWGYMKQAW